MTKDDLIVLAKGIAEEFHLPAKTFCGLVEQESAWNTYAIRSESESGFMRRYGEAYQKIVKATATRYDDRWIKFEDIFYASYGLGQVMYPVLIERVYSIAKKLKYPTELCSPRIGLEASATILKQNLTRAEENVHTALLRYNGGGDPEYPDKVMDRARKY